MSDHHELAGASVLITGGMGFIGSSYARRCLDDGAHVRVLDCFLAGSGANRANLEGILDRVEFIEGDVRDAALVSKAVRGTDLILHSAAQTSHTRSMEDALLTLDVNIRGTLQLLEAVRESQADPKLVHVGTTTQLGPMIRHPIDESHPEFPRDVYSATMVGSEKFVLLYAHAHDIRATVVRLSNSYGPRAAIHSPDLGFINYFIGLGLQKKDLTVYGDGRQLRSLLYVDDAIDALNRAALTEASDGEVYLASSDEAYTVSDIAKAIGRCAGVEVRHVPWPAGREAIEVGNAVIDNSKIRQDLGWRPTVGLETGLARTFAYFEESLSSYLPQAAKR